MLVFSDLGVSPTVLAAITGGLSVGVGFGLREILGNFISGLWLMFEGAIKPGDVIELNGDACQVRGLGVRASSLWRDRDDAELVVPNQNFFTNAMTTYTRSHPQRCGVLSVSVSDQHDPSRIRDLLTEIVASQSGVLSEPVPEILVAGFGTSTLEYHLRFWISHPMDFIRIRSALAEALWRRLGEQGIDRSLG